MRLWQEIFSQLGDGGTSEGVISLSYTVWEGKGGYFQNIKSLVSFSPQQIVFALRRGALLVSGEGLSVAKYCENDVIIRGNILSVAREGV